MENLVALHALYCLTHAEDCLHEPMPCEIVDLKA